LEVFERRPPAAVFAAPFVIGRHPKTFTTAVIPTNQFLDRHYQTGMILRRLFDHLVGAG